MPGVGKTSLMMRLREHLSIDILNEHKSDFWDLRGEPLHNHLPMNYERIEAALIIYDVSRPETFFEVEGYLQLIRTKCPQLPVAIIGNKIDLDTRIVPEEVTTMFTKTSNVSHYELSALTGAGIQDFIESQFKTL
jgi:GTPase SAR1 family protein